MILQFWLVIEEQICFLLLLICLYWYVFFFICVALQPMSILVYLVTRLSVHNLNCRNTICISVVYRSLCYILIFTTVLIRKLLVRHAQPQAENGTLNQQIELRKFLLFIVCCLISSPATLFTLSGHSHRELKCFPVIYKL